MNCATNKDSGNSALALAIAYYGSNGYTVSIPLNDTQDYDLIVDDGTLKRVQVKSTRYNPTGTFYKVSLKSSGGTKGVIYKHVVDTEVEILFVVTCEKTMYEIPIDKVIVRSQITLNEDFDKFIVTI